jgi:ketosteroid isomerase-like protein
VAPPNHAATTWAAREGEAVDHTDIERWIAAYENAWRSSGTTTLGELFTADATYLPSPWARPVEGLGAIARFWDAGRDGPHEVFTMSHEVVAVDGDTAVVRVAVDYGAPVAQRWRDLWVVRLDAQGRCTAFEEWPFAPGQPDGHDNWRRLAQESGPAASDDPHPA